VILTRGWSVFLVLAGVFNWVVWPRFAIAIWQDQRAWDGTIGSSGPTAFLLVHAVLIAAALAIGTTVGVLGARGLIVARRTPAG
jgi:intracellular septation protein A